jgi:hypothetical protein
MKLESRTSKSAVPILDGSSLLTYYLETVLLLITSTSIEVGWLAGGEELYEEGR